ncbi:MAG TPA: DUF6112 family protein [Sporichthyaceae bacterium]|nr:DUF6112 family protein [Sporichthyaceae bacterium]
MGSRGITWTSTGGGDSSWTVAADPGITANNNGLPGLEVLRHLVGGLLTWGLIACVAGLAVSVIVWALGHHQGNYSHASTGKTGVLVSAGGALLIGGANGIITFFSAMGAHIQ